MTTIPTPLAEALADRYRLEREIGRGGMATVYLAHDRKHGRGVAVKVLRADLTPVLGADRFLREIEIAARLSHPHILPLYDSGEAAETLFYVMPFVEGESVRALLDRTGLVDTVGVVQIVRRVADALDYAHRQGILHRDIKPENILLPEGHAVVADFGIAKALSDAVSGRMTQTGIALGTPGYMSPEQAAGLTDLDASTDVYSLAVVTYEMVTGGLPGVWLMPADREAGRFPGAQEPHRLKLDRLPAGFERALVRALQLRSEDRFPTPGEFADALERPDTMARPADPLPLPERVPEETDRTLQPRAARTPAAPRDPLEGEGGFLGGPTSLWVEREVEGEVLEEDLETLASEIRTHFGVQGHLTTAGRSLLWSGRAPKKSVSWVNWTEAMEEAFRSDDGPRVMVRIRSRGGRTVIRIEQKLGDLAGGLYGGLFGGGGGTAIPAAILLTLVGGAPVEVGVAAGMGIVGGFYGLTRWIYRSVVRSKQRGLERLAESLADGVEETAV